MSFLSFFKNKSQPNTNETTRAAEKVNVNNVYNREEEFKTVTKFVNQDKIEKEFESELLKEIVSVESLRKLSWHGIPHKFRSRAWKLILQYLPTNSNGQKETQKRKREEYKEYITKYYENRDTTDEKEIKIYKLIQADVNRTQPEYPLFHTPTLQLMLTRILYIWHIKHPASGYVQGINDLTTPFIIVFLSDYIELDYQTLSPPANFDTLISEESFLEIEADTFFCMTRILMRILDNYTQSQPGITRALEKVTEVVKRMDKDLFDHLQGEGVEFFQFAFRWLYCLLIREFKLKLALRLFDTYIADEEGFTSLHVYMCAALILKFGQKLKKLGFNEIMIFLQNLPTKEWSNEDLMVLISEAFVFQNLFDFSKAHLTL